MVANIDETLSAGPQAASWRRNFLQRLTSATSRSISVNEVFEQYLAVHISSFDTSIQQEVRNHLIWLAKQMNKRHQGDFYLEGLQKDWLEDKHLQPVEQLQIRYQRWGVFGLSCILGASLNLVLNNIFGLSDIPYILIYALLGGLVGGLLVQENNAKHPLRSQLATGLLQGVIVTAVVTSSYLLYVADHSMTWHDWWHNVIVYAPVFGVCTLLLHLLKTMGWIVNSRQAARSMALSRIPLKLLQGRLFQKLQQIKLRYISNGILVGLVIAIGITLSDGLTDGPMHLWDDTARDFVLFVLTTSILSFGLARAKVSEEIQPVDIRSFSLSLLWQRLTSLQHMLISMIIGVSTFWVLLFTSGLDTGFVETFQNQHGQGITYGFEAALIYWLLFGFYSSLSSNTIPRDWGRFPNQSIKLSGCNGLMFGISFGCLWWLITICAGLNQGIAIAIQAGKTYGLLVGLAGGLFFWHDAWGYRIYSALPFTPFPCKNRYHHIPLY